MTAVSDEYNVAAFNFLEWLPDNVNNIAVDVISL